MAHIVKWVKVREGLYKLVEDDDPRPAVKLKSHRGAPNIKYVPPWKKYESPMWFGGANDQIKASEQFTQERDREMQKDPKAARWEKSRREWFAKQKRGWRDKELKKLREQGL
jgi:hypothetical protein